MKIADVIALYFWLAVYLAGTLALVVWIASPLFR